MSLQLLFVAVFTLVNHEIDYYCFKSRRVVLWKLPGSLTLKLIDQNHPLLKSCRDLCFGQWCVAQCLFANAQKVTGLSLASTE